MAEWQVVEHLGEQVHHLGRVLGLDFVLEAVHLVRCQALMVTWERGRGSESVQDRCGQSVCEWESERVRNWSDFC